MSNGALEKLGPTRPVAGASRAQPRAIPQGDPESLTGSTPYGLSGISLRPCLPPDMGARNRTFPNGPYKQVDTSGSYRTFGIQSLNPLIR